MAGAIKKKTAAASKRKADVPPAREPESEAPDNDENQEGEEDEGVPPKRKHTAAASDSEAHESDEHEEGEAAPYDGSTYPKGARSAFSFWKTANRGKFSMKGAGRAWRGLKDKSEWDEMAKLDKERYEREMVIYDEKHAGDEE